jgi:voltage-gated potassium channel
MPNVVFLIMRRMRSPLLMLIGSYAIAILGLVLIPGQDPAGHPIETTFFHAFYIVSYTSTTIGFGEIPYPFTDLQRLWVTFCIFMTVGVWIYAAGTLIALLQEPTFRQALDERRFRRRVGRLRDPFYLVCGYGQTGSALVWELTNRHRRAVVIDSDPARVAVLALKNLREYVPGLCGDAGIPANLESAGLKHPLCAGVVALTNSNEANLKIAIAAKLLHPNIQVVCRSDSHDVEANMASFGTDHIYDPFDIFALYMAIAIEAPCLAQLFGWLSGRVGETLRAPMHPPAEGRWVICGYGRFGKAMYRHLKDQGLNLVVIEEDPELTGTPEGGAIRGRGTEASTLEQADIQRSAGLVAGTDNDATNLSIAMTALALNPRLFVIARRNELATEELFDRVGARVVMHPSSVIAQGIRIRLALPLLSEFFTLARFRDEAWACELAGRIAALIADRAPHTWQLKLDEASAPALCEACERGLAVTLGALLRDPRDPGLMLPAIPLLLEHAEQRELTPDLGARLRKGDRLLLCGRQEARRPLDYRLQRFSAMRYVVTGEDLPEGWAWRQAVRLGARLGARPGSPSASQPESLPGSPAGKPAGSPPVPPPSEIGPDPGPN